MRRKGGRWSGADLLLGLFLLLSVAGLIGRIVTLGGSDAPTGEPLTATLRLTGYDPRTAACIGVGERVYAADGRAVGVVEAVETRGARVTVLCDGVRVHGRRDAAVLCELDVTLRLVGGTAGGSPHTEVPGTLAVGGHCTLFTDRAALVGEWIAVTRESDGI